MPKRPEEPDFFRQIDALGERVRMLERHRHPLAEETADSHKHVHQYLRLQGNRNINVGDSVQTVASGSETFLTFVRGLLFNENDSLSSTVEMGDDNLLWVSTANDRITVKSRQVVSILSVCEFAWAVTSTTGFLFEYQIHVNPGGTGEVLHTASKVLHQRQNQQFQVIGLIGLPAESTIRVSVKQNAGVDMTVNSSNLTVGIWGMQ